MMELSRFKTIWGIPAIHLKEYSKRYRLISLALYTLDVVAIFGLTTLLYFLKLSYETYGFVVLFVCILLHFGLNFFLNPEKWEAFKFYRRHENCEVSRLTYNVDADILYSVLYCSGYKRLKQDKSFDFYKELMLSACCENIKYAKLFMKYLEKYRSDDGNLSCYSIKKGKSFYLIDFDDSSLKEDNENVDDNE